jgi:glutamine cyclotransferase
MSRHHHLGLLSVGLASAACSGSGTQGAVGSLVTSVHESYPHARDAFTQGLVYQGNWIYESTGLEGRSSLRRVEVETGRVDERVSLPDDVFGEGLAAVGARLVQLTWQSQRAFVYDLESLQLERELGYEGEGWGLCYDGERLVMSDGSNVLQFRDPETFERIGEIEVLRQGEPLEQLNELECVGGEVYANVWLTTQIARVDAASGEVTGMIDAGDLLSHDDFGDTQGIDVLNGIAYVPERQRFLVTGKYWPRMFEVTFEPRPAPEISAY